MSKDLEKIKTKYGEKMSHLCRDLFSTLLEEDGLLFSLLESKFEHSKFLYDDIVKNNLEEEFKNYIYSFVDVEKQKIAINKTPQQLLDEKGYILYECHNEEEIQSFKKYYFSGEELCTFKGNRLNRCHVFFAVKKNVDKIKREDFKNPTRQDLYGTSVISIQFTKGTTNTLSIKNRYNHTVNNPDATFSNNLDNIIEGLTESFEREYNLNINYNKNSFEIPGYVKANDGKLYKYNYEIDNIYYCPNNIIIDNFEVKREYQQNERYIVLDYFVLDMKEKNIFLYNEEIEDSFIDTIKGIENIEVKKEKDKKEIIIITKEGQAKIVVDNKNRIIEYKNNYIKEIGDGFLHYNETLEELDLPNAEITRNSFMYENEVLKRISIPKVKKIRNYFLYYNETLEEINLPNVEIIGNFFMHSNKVIKHHINTPKTRI